MALKIALSFATSNPPSTPSRTTMVLAYRPKGKGEAATKVRKQIAKADRKAKKDGARE